MEMQWRGVSMLFLWLKTINRQEMNALNMSFIHFESGSLKHAMIAYSL